jgi:hypothetical protein
VAARAVAAIMPECDRLGQRDVEPGGASDGGGHLRYFESVGQPGALMVEREDKDLGLASQATKSTRVQDAVAITLETGAQDVRLLWRGPVPGPPGQRGPRGQQELLCLLAGLPGQQFGADAWVGRVAMGANNLARRLARRHNLTRSHSSTVATEGDRNERR